MKSSPLAWGFIGFLACLLGGGLFGLPQWFAVGGGTACLAIGAWGQNLLDALYDRGDDDGEETQDTPRNWF